MLFFAPSFIIEHDIKKAERINTSSLQIRTATVPSPPRSPVVAQLYEGAATGTGGESGTEGPQSGSGAWRHMASQKHSLCQRANLKRLSTTSDALLSVEQTRLATNKTKPKLDVNDTYVPPSSPHICIHAPQGRTLPHLPQALVN